LAGCAPHQQINFPVWGVFQEITSGHIADVLLEDNRVRVVPPVRRRYLGVNLDSDGDIKSRPSRAEAQPTSSSKQVDGC
jgi:hypothetical protein